MRGLPDFQATPGDPPVLPPFEGSGPWSVLPESLAIATAADGRPELSLELVRGVDPESPPAPYAMLELELTAASRLDDALAAVRTTDPAATIARAAFDGGSLQLRAVEPGAPADLAEPAQLVWHGLEDARWVLRLSEASGALLRRALLDATLAVVAQARLAVLGISPRLPLVAAPDVARLRAALAELGATDGTFERDAALSFMRGDAPGLPFEFTGDPAAVDREALAQALTDAALPLVATEDHAVPGLWRLDERAEAAPPAALRLSEPRVTRRPVLLELDPLTAAR
ncbi:MAG: hypothetical protein QOG63_18, partial [Thermoleophilaceae bacterium]|nr:hypothetical protein [Thermoleophilaceae bacterium]